MRHVRASEQDASFENIKNYSLGRLSDRARSGNESYIRTLNESYGRTLNVEL